jgi:hypothetical protein
MYKEIAKAEKIQVNEVRTASTGHGGHDAMRGGRSPAVVELEV